MNAIQSTLLKAVPVKDATTSGTSSASSTSSSASSSSANSAAQAASDAADRFLTLLVAQLQNQDPLNPLDNAQITTQLAQISTVNGINQLNTTVSSLGASLGVTQYLQAASLVGHDVIVSGNNIDLADGTAQGGMTLNADADIVKVTISDASGNVVRTLDLGAQKAGTQTFAWDGKTDAGGTAPDGHYTFAITATAAGKAVSFDTLMAAHVDGVQTTASGPTLQLAGGTQVPLAQVVQIH
jgi:flagellar basal-body rod modification protein FlgD